ncbi:MAG: MBL fold metallo-hydrolase [Bacteroidetes bacterium]|nr:MBL fold metallo-hydrolase [Bacteroidota bacterium]MCH7770678.1 MBL fold metallo-hydrolase [Bacteroidota bacterium]
MDRRKFIIQSAGLTLAGIIAPSLITNYFQYFAKEESTFDLYKPSPQDWKSDEVNISWIGHSTILINMFGTIILTDPVLFDSVGIYVLGLTIGKIRATKPALEFNEIPEPDLVLISHAHMDHMDYKSLKELTEKYPGKADCITAYNTKDIIEDLKWKSLSELDWGESVYNDELKITGIAVNHNGFRLPGEMDRADGYILNGRSYNGYILEKYKKKILFAGDTAYTEKFKQHRSKNIDVAIMPIGGYIPHQNRHCNPEESLIMASEHLGAEYFIPIHCNTFDGDEGFHAPIDWMLKSAVNYNIEIGISEIGQTLTLDG